MRTPIRMLLSMLVIAATGAIAAPAGASHDADRHSPNMSVLFESPNATGAINSDLAFWGDRAYAGNYDGFRIFDISDPASPQLLSDFACFGPQNDPAVWENKLLFLAIDRTLSGPECGSVAVDHGDPTGWEGVRIFDVSDPTAPEQVGAVYTDCGAHTITLYPKSDDEVLLYVSSYPLRPGPTCGATNGPAAGRDPLHGVIQVVNVPVNNPGAAAEIAEPPITYPGDPDNKFVWGEHGLAGPGLELAARACHDISVLVDKRLASAACAEQAQLWRIGPDGIPDTANPVWVFDDNVDENGATGDPADKEVAVDFWHSATFSADGSVINFIDESFGDGCPPVTPITQTGETEATLSDTGRMFFVDTKSGKLLSSFMLPRTEPTAYCSAHLGNTVKSKGKDLLVNAWYMGGVDVIDFTNPKNPREVAFFDHAPVGATGSDNWSAYWYEGPSLAGGNTLTIYATDGVHNPATGRGFQVFRAKVGVNEQELGFLNPQTQ